MSTEIPLRAWVEVRESALRRNLETVKGASGPGVRLLCMVKANAYGLGVERVVRTLSEGDPWAYGVATVEEGRELRDLGITRPILVFSPVPPGAEDAAVEADLTLCLSDPEGLLRVVRASGRQDRDAAVHLEIDTGMGRAGFRDDRVGDWGPAVGRILGEDEGRSAGGEAGAHRVRVEGLFTHFHSADEAEPRARESMAEQRRRFRSVRDRIGRWVGGDPLWHVSNSAGLLRGPADGRSGEAVRPGLFLYGGRVGPGLPAPEPVVSVRARVVRVTEVAAGATQGYGATYRAEGPERWATLAIGYGDGLPRALSNRGRAILGGRDVPIVGRISMDMTVVDITDAGRVEVGDVATLVGVDGDRSRSLEDVAGEAQTVPYEILTGLSARLPRVWHSE